MSGRADPAHEPDDVEDDQILQQHAQRDNPRNWIAFTQNAFTNVSIRVVE